MGNYHMAIEDLTKIINITSHLPALYHCLLRRGRRLWFDGQYDRALSDMNRAIALNPDSQVGYDFRSVINLARGSSQQAITDMQHSKKINPKGEVSHFHLGYFYHEKGRKDKAKSNFFKAREFNPNIIKMFNNRQKRAVSTKTRNFYRKEIAVAREYLEGQLATGFSGPKNISLQIISMNIRPAIVRPGSKFELTVDFVVVDPTAGQNQIPIKFSYEINIGKKVLYQSETKIITSPNGIVRGQVVQLKASRNRGFYNIEALLKYKNQRTKKHTTFEIGEPKKTPPLKSSKKIDF
jgi:tetratricopeptide (TPR) repeat protein